MKAGISGSVGFLGANLVSCLYSLRRDDLEVVPFYSHRRSNPLTNHLNLPYEHLDVTSKQEVLEKTRGLDVLFHLAGAVDYSRKNARQTWDVNVLGAKNIFDAAIQNNIQRLVYVSSINVLGTTGADLPPADESNDTYGSSRNPISFHSREQALEAIEESLRGDYSFLRHSRVSYFDSKLAAYELAVDYHRKHDLPVVVVFPGTAVGRGDVGISITELVYLVFSGKLKFTLPGGTSFVSAEDVAEGIWMSYLRGTPGQSYLITGREEDNLRYKEFMKRIAKVARTRYNRVVSDSFVTVPAPVCYTLARVMRLLSAEGQLSEGLILSGIAIHRFSHAKANRALGFHPKVSLEHSIEACIDFYIENTTGDR
jgi:dihydroflavonol-4-reductase